MCACLLLLGVECMGARAEEVRRREEGRVGFCEADCGSLESAHPRLVGLRTPVE